MTQWLRQSTAVTVKMGPFLDATDGDTEMTALTISQADIRLTKNGGAFAQTNNAAGATHDENGFYGVPLDTTDTNTLGALKVFIHEATALSVWQDFMVVPANVWDSLFGADKLQVHVDEMTAGIVTAAAIADGAIDAATFAAGAINAAAIATDAIDGDAIAASAVTEIQSGLATAASLAATDARLDTEIPAIITSLATIDARLDTEIPAILAAVDTEIAAIKVVTDQLVAAGSDPTGVPSHTDTPLKKLERIHQALHCELRVSTTTLEFRTQAGAVLWTKALADAGTYIESKGA